jgi:hypothetical protein
VSRRRQAGAGALADEVALELPEGSVKNLGQAACLSRADRPGWGLTARAGLMQWTVRLEARTDQGEVETTELVTLNRLVVDGSLAELGLALSEAKAVMAKLQVTMVQSQLAKYMGYKT